MVCFHHVADVSVAVVPLCTAVITQDGEIGSAGPKGYVHQIPASMTWIHIN